MTDQRLIEDYIPIEAISSEARREKSIRKGHISTLHLWWARRPLVACRAAVYGALVPAPADKRAARQAADFVADLCTYPGPRDTVAQARRHILEAHAQRLTAERVGAGLVPAQALVTVEDIEAGRAPRPRVLDMFAGGGAIPLEALRLGCEAYALDLNPVAHLIQLCTLVYPQQFGAPDPTAVGSGEGRMWAGLAKEVEHWGKWVLKRVKAEIGDLYPPIPDPTTDQRPPTTGQYALDLAVPAVGGRPTPEGFLTPVAYLWTRTVRCKNPACGGTVPLARQTWLAKKKGRYIALCPDAEANRHKAPGEKTVRYQVVEASTEKDLGFDPAAGSRGGDVACPFCGTVADSAYVKAEGRAGRIGTQLMAVVCTRPGQQGKVYLAAAEVSQTSLGLRSPQLVEDNSLAPGRSTTGQPAGHGPAQSDEDLAPGRSTTGQPTGYGPVQSSEDLAPGRSTTGQPTGHGPVQSSGSEQSQDSGGGSRQVEDKPDAAIWGRIRALEAETARDPAGPLTVPDEPIITDAKGSAWVIQYGLEHFGDLFTPRQLLSLLTFARQVRAAHAEMLDQGYGPEQAQAVATYLGVLVNRLADYNSSLCSWHNTGEKIGHTYARQALPMVWDFVELNPLGNASGNALSALDWIIDVIKSSSNLGPIAQVRRSSAAYMPFETSTLDAIITDPPYYDNVAYADLSDFFYVWLKRSIGHLHPEHCSSLLTPKKNEAVADATRHGGDRERAARVYEEMMAQSFAEAGRVLKPGAPLVIVYAHKTTLGWATLVDALRAAGFTVTEAWPLDTEMGARVRAIDTASLASSIFLVARRREGSEAASYEREVRPDLQRIVRERVDRLWAQGVTGADLVIACVGAGLRAFTRFARVEYANGEPVPADSFLTEVEGTVLEVLLEKLFGVSQAGVSSVDPVTRFYVLWRYAYRGATLDAGEAIVFAYPQHVELDGPNGLSSGSNPLVEKGKGKYRLRDFAERGQDEGLGLPSPPGKAPQTGGYARAGGEGAAPLIDALHRLLWLVEHRPAQIPAYLDQARPDVERLRVVAQALAGQTLAGNGGGGPSLVAARGPEAAALRKLTTNWRTLIEAHRGPMV